MTSEIKNPAVLNKNNLAVKAGWMTVFNIAIPSREYFSFAEEYLAEGVGIPANAYLDKPLKVKKGFAVCRSADKSRWEYQPDHRGEIRYSTVTGSVIIISDIGDYPEDSTALAPTAPLDKWDGAQWVVDTDQQAAIARRYRDVFIHATDPMMVNDYSIDDIPLREDQRNELNTTRLAFKQWPKSSGWPFIELPVISPWLLIEAVNNGYVVPTWPEAPADVA
ncbi:tail fiber assembly protein [Yersinia ruckeri]|uniref:tail fiber assembly protein n=1 Tax=Yersinia ruckeri TaxID=29486 RepID=UPI0022391217|nr:tail fiber assembly protein [Yersinia ruckeri]MCW6546993.1 tail fiber assembly protein [Yersinia ruckeri]MCW6573138.1 tail fiber assembly protein [Yersinia ruckeri]UZX55833.1 tail fiber assembly protein [Yersinia ruckeri]